MAFRLPPLNTLRLFEAAGRHLSFKLAAQELSVTPSAISHGLQTLEDWLGAPLFVRGPRGLTLTEAGRAYLPAVQRALEGLAQAGDRLLRGAARRSLAISVVPTFGARLLLPRLGTFQALHPDLAVTIDTSYRAVEFPRDGFDIAIRMGTGQWPGLEAVHVLQEELVPVCTPALRDRGARSPLIRLVTAAEDWDAWWRLAGVPPVDCSRGISVDTVAMALQAAVQGLGIALGRLPLCAAELESGALVPAGPVVRGDTGYWLVGLPGVMARPEVADFRDWLLGEVAGMPVSLPHLPVTSPGLRRDAVAP